MTIESMHFLLIIFAILVSAGLIMYVQFQIWERAHEISESIRGQFTVTLPKDISSVQIHANGGGAWGGAGRGKGDPVPVPEIDIRTNVRNAVNEAALENYAGEFS